MFAIVEIAGQQFKVEKDTSLFVHRLDEKEGNKITLDKVLLIGDEGKVKIGAPLVKDAQVSAVVKSHLKGDKVKVFKKKRRKGYQVLNGHRQFFTEIVVTGIKEKAAPAKSKSAQVQTATPKAESDKKKTTAKSGATKTTATKTAGTAKKATTSSTTKSTKTKAKATETKSGTAKKSTTTGKSTTSKSAAASKTTAKETKGSSSKSKKDSKPSTEKK